MSVVELLLSSIRAALASAKLAILPVAADMFLRGVVGQCGLLSTSERTAPPSPGASAGHA
jgi:hypothetical protein